MLNWNVCTHKELLLNLYKRNKTSLYEFIVHCINSFLKKQKKTATIAFDRHIPEKKRVSIQYTEFFYASFLHSFFPVYIYLLLSSIAIVII